MSGIAGALVYSGQNTSMRLVQCLTSKMRHRGPHGTHHWVSGNVALGQCMLKSTSRSAFEALPLVNSEPGLALVMDGRIDNRAELYGKLQPRFNAQAAPDSAYVLEAYTRWGRDCPKYLLGDFAFVVWDIKTQSLFCVRDQIGARTLYYVQAPGYFAFASDTEALLHLPDVSSAPNEEAIASLLMPDFENRGDRRTWNRDVLAVWEGESISVDLKGELRCRRFWEASPAREQTYHSEEEAGEHFTEVFQTAVADRTDLSVDSSMMLSGGLDSAGIAVAVSNLCATSSGSKVHAYSAVDDESDSCVESRSILGMAETLGLVQHQVRVPSFEGMVNAQDLSDAAWNQAHPVDSALLLPAMMALAASRHGHRSMMHGVSGDMAWHSPMYYPSELIRARKFRLAWQESSLASQNHVYLKGTPTRTIFRRSLVNAVTSTFARSHLSRMRKLRQPSPIAASPINPDFAMRLKLLERLKEQESYKRKVSSKVEKLVQFKNNLAEIRSGLSAFTRVTARYGVEVSDPWADRRVLEFMYRLPMKYRVKKGWTKYLLRTILSERLPVEVVWRKDKMHLGWQFAARFMADRSAEVEQLLLDEMDVLGHYVSTNVVLDLHRNLATKFDFDQQDRLFGFVTLMLWLRRLRIEY